MTCPLCNKKKQKVIFSKKESAIWTNFSPKGTKKEKRFKCVLKQCQNCGHVYQPFNKKLSLALNKIYQSSYAQASTEMGKGNWGLIRASSFFKTIKLEKFKSALEIGCASGFLLRHLKKNGLKELVGIEPSIKRKDEKGIRFLKKFVNDELTLNKRFDLIFSAWVFEHIQSINSVLRFCGKHLSNEGTLLFCSLFNQFFCNLFTAVMINTSFSNNKNWIFFTDISFTYFHFLTY